MHMANSTAKQQLFWQRVQEMYGNETADTCSTYRAEVPGGWLVSVWAGQKPTPPYKDTNFQTWGGGVTFVPDPSHSWKLDPHPRQ